MTVTEIIERLLDAQHEHGGGFAQAMSHLDDAWFHVVLDHAQSALADQEEGNSAIAELAAAAIAMEAESEEVEITVGLLGERFFAVLDTIEAERLRRAG